jgi:hypothetical protein
MILPHTNILILVLMIAGMFCWGSWANTFKLARSWRFELYYFDFAFGLMLFALVYALTVGNLGFDGFGFMDSVMNAGKRESLPWGTRSCWRPFRRQAWRSRFRRRWGRRLSLARS